MSEQIPAEPTKFADWERCDKRHGSQAAHLLDCDDSAILRDRQPSRGGVIRGTPLTIQVRTNANGLTEYWEAEGSRWVPVFTAEQMRQYWNRKP